MNSVEYWIEQFGIEKVQASGIPEDLTCAHYDAAPRATDNRIVFRAKSGPVESEGPGCNEVELTVELRMTKRDVNEIDGIFAKIESAFDNPTATPAVAMFAVLEGKSDEAENEREARKDTRHRLRQFHFLAKLA